MARTWTLVWVVLAQPVVCSQEFECVQLNDGNTNLFVAPDACAGDPGTATWCNCVTSAFTRPVKGETSGYNQALTWVLEQPGIGNHRVEVDAGTLDLSGVRVDDVIGDGAVREIIPQAFPLVGGQFFTVEAEVRVVAVREDSLDFHVNITSASAAVVVAIFYDPTDVFHSSGHFLTGRLSSNGAGRGFTLEYRYATENFRFDPARAPGLEPGEVANTIFTVPFLLRYFTTESAVYRLPDQNSIDVLTTLRQFTEESLDEILPLGAADLCHVQRLPDPCKTFHETVDLRDSEEENEPPQAVIQPLDPVTGFVLAGPIELQTECGSARVLFRGRNSRDGDGGFQPLEYEWSVAAGPEDGAILPESMRLFKDIEITFIRAGTYEVALRVRDPGGASGESRVAVIVRSDFDSNVAPTAVIDTIPDPPLVRLVNGVASVQLDGSRSSNGIPGEDDCGQPLSFLWRQVATTSPLESFVLDPDQPFTQVLFEFPGSYTIELEVSDGAAKDSVARTRVDIVVEGDVPELPFRRGDSDEDGEVSITDAISLLNWLFLGGTEPSCRDAADSDDDGKVGINDAIHVLRFLFLGRTPPAPPGPSACGPDPTNDALPPCLFRGC